MELAVLALAILAVFAVFAVLVLFFFAGGGEGDSGIYEIRPEQMSRLAKKIIVKRMILDAVELNGLI